MSLATDHIGPWTVADVLALPEDRSVRYELKRPRNRKRFRGPRVSGVSGQAL